MQTSVGNMFGELIGEERNAAFDRYRRLLTKSDGLSDAEQAELQTILNRLRKKGPDAIRDSELLRQAISLKMAIENSPVTNELGDLGLQLVEANRRRKLVIDKANAEVSAARARLNEFMGRGTHVSELRLTLRELTLQHRELLNF
jgi:hypothetical protein